MGTKLGIWAFAVFSVLGITGLFLGASQAQDRPNSLDDNVYELTTTLSGAPTTVYKNLADILADAPGKNPTWNLDVSVVELDLYFSVINHTNDGVLCVSPRLRGEPSALLSPSDTGYWSVADVNGGVRSSFCHSYNNLTFPIYLDIPDDMLRELSGRRRFGRGVGVRLRTYKPSPLATDVSIADIPVAVDLRFREGGYRTVGYYWPGNDDVTGSRWVEDPFILEAEGQSWPALVIKAREADFQFSPAPTNIELDLSDDLLSVSRQPTSIVVIEDSPANNLIDVSVETVTDSGQDEFEVVADVADLSATTTVIDASSAEPSATLAPDQPSNQANLGGLDLDLSTRVRFDIKSTSPLARQSIYFSFTGFGAGEVSVDALQLADLTDSAGIFVRFADTPDSPMAISRAVLTVPGRDFERDVTRFFFDKREYFGIRGRHLLEGEENVLSIEVEPR
ncbi:MAG: hypothetical protein AAGF33_07850 [Pseudomonadota bacterium]